MLDHERRAPSRLERMLAHALLLFLGSSVADTGPFRAPPDAHRCWIPGPITGAPAVRVSALPRCIAGRVPAPAAPPPPNSTMPRITTDRSLASRRVELPDPMPFESFVFVFVVFEFLLTYR